ncbi:MAG: hypothetical protein ACREXU_11100 [Gammaproteobacteria bacterium]
MKSCGTRSAIWQPRTGPTVRRGGNDVLKSGANNDQLFGQRGNDAMDGGLGSGDNCNGGGGTDTATRCEQPRGVP